MAELPGVSLLDCVVKTATDADNWRKKYFDSLGNPSWVNLSKFRKVTIKYA